MIKTEQPINFQAVACAANVSTDFLYNHAQLRRRIEQHRTARRSPQQTTETEDSGTSGAVRALTAQLKALRARHREEVMRLQAALATAHGENLELRRALAARQDCAG